GDGGDIVRADVCAGQQVERGGGAGGDEHGGRIEAVRRRDGVAERGGIRRGVAVQSCGACSGKHCRVRACRVQVRGEVDDGRWIDAERQQFILAQTAVHDTMSCVAGVVVYRWVYRWVHRKAFSMSAATTRRSAISAAASARMQARSMS